MNLKVMVSGSALAVVCVASSASAQPILVADGSLPGSGGDLSAATAAPLENGVPGNRLGGLGSGLTNAGGDIFIAIPDRGPNATPYNPCVDDTASYIPRFQTLRLQLAPNAGYPAAGHLETPASRRRGCRQSSKGSPSAQT